MKCKECKDTGFIYNEYKLHPEGTNIVREVCECQKQPEPVSEFTPGPWIVGEDAISKTPLVHDSRSITIADIFRIPEYEANARLIASAPEMLEALVEAYNKNAWWGEANYHRWEKKFELQVAAIIEKATGRKP